MLIIEIERCPRCDIGLIAAFKRIEQLNTHYSFSFSWVLVSRVLYTSLILVLICSCQLGSEWEDSRLMDRYVVEFTSEEDSFEIKTLPEINDHVRLYGVYCADGSLEKTWQAESSYDEINHIQSRTFHSVPWLTIKGESKAEYSDMLDDFTIEVEYNSSGSIRTCMLVFIAHYKKEIVAVTQH